MEESRKNIILESRFSIGDADVNVYFSSTGWQKLPQSFENAPRHNHACYEFHFIKKGVMNFRTDTATHAFGEGDALLIPPKIFHSNTLVMGYTEIYNFSFELHKNKKEKTERLFDKLSEALGETECRVFENNPKLSFFIEELGRFHGEEDKNVSRINNIVTSILFVLYDELCPTEQGVNEKRDTAVESLSSSLNFMSLDDAIHLSLSEFAKKSFLSTKQINRICRQNYNMTYKQRQILFRIENAKKLLSETDMPVDEIARSVGYKNLTSFYRAFDKQEGISPAAYRKGRE